MALLTHHHIIYSKRLHRPDVLPLYYNANEWVISAWWDSTVETNTANLTPVTKP